jgi:hypothetical protein
MQFVPSVHDLFVPNIPEFLGLFPKQIDTQFLLHYDVSSLEVKSKNIAQGEAFFQVNITTISGQGAGGRGQGAGELCWQWCAVVVYYITIFVKQYQLIN